MENVSLDFIDYPESELVIGLVAPTGTDTDNIQGALKERLEHFGYTPQEIKLSDLLRRVEHGVEIKDRPKFDRIWSLMDAGDAFREKIKRGDALGLMAVSEISQERPVDEQSKEQIKPKKPRPKTAHILDSLKHPHEVIALRRIYGVGFFLVAIFASQDNRLNYLKENDRIPEDQAKQLIERDQDEIRPSGLGQKTRDTFYLADAFIDATNLENARTQLWRILELIFGNSYRTPTNDEHAMFLAFATSFRSADLSRQVGAVITSKESEILAVGTNDVPCHGGGLYSADHPNDMRDYVLGKDVNSERKTQMFRDIARMVKDNYLPKDSEISEDELLKDTKKHLAGSLLSSITEFGRAVHAEMEALSSCARKGISPRGGTLYTTTFPCHNCAKHIVASGIERVVYVEPYPKSQAGELHEDSIDLEGRADGKVKFQPFVGIGSRRFMDLFSMGLSSGYAAVRKLSGTSEKIEWILEVARVRVPMLPTSYIEREKVSVDELNKLLEEKNETEKENG
jgi:deoxycytidylate deaminase